MPSLSSIRGTAHTLMNHPACETLGWQFIAGSGFKSRQHRASMRTSQLSWCDVAIHYFITENIFYSLWSNNIFWRPTSSIEPRYRHWNLNAHQAASPSKTVEETFKNEMFFFLFVFIFAEVTGHIMEERTKRGNVVENKISHFHMIGGFHHLLHRRTSYSQLIQVASELCSSRSI